MTDDGVNRQLEMIRKENENNARLVQEEREKNMQLQLQLNQLRNMLVMCNICDEYFTSRAKKNQHVRTFHLSSE